MNNTKLLEELAKKRQGGSEAIKGFIYQSQYAIYQMLKDFTVDKSKVFVLEGIEDIDLYHKIEDKSSNTFIQVKCKKNGLSTTDFKNDIFQNFIELHLIDNSANLQIVCSNNLKGGEFKKVIDSNSKGKKLHDTVFNFWKRALDELKQEKVNWNFSNFDLSTFLSKLSFQRITENKLEKEIIKLVVEGFSVFNGTENQFINALYYQAFQWSKQSSIIDYKMFISVIEDVKTAQAKSPTNKAIQEKWITKVIFENSYNKNILNSYFTGKSAKPYHIHANLPVRRKEWESQIKETLNRFDATVIKASSGQGKSTLAWQVTYDLRKIYTPYEITFLEEQQNVGEIINYFETLIKIGILPLVVIDGLKYSLKAWSELVRQTSHLPIKYLITTREEDWFYYRDISLNLQTIDIYLNINEAKSIFRTLKRENRLDKNITHWQSAWEKVKDKGLLIEYVYLLTQGNMLQERLSNQLDNLRSDAYGNPKRQILELVATADVCGVRISTKQLLKLFDFQGGENQILGSLQDEYQVIIQDKKYVEGLHRVRSEHLMDLLHELRPISITLEKLFDFLPSEQLLSFTTEAALLLQYETEQKDFFSFLVKKVVKKSYVEIVSIIKGVYATDAYYHWEVNQNIYDDLFSGKGGLIYAMNAMLFNPTNLLTDIHEKNLNSDNPNLVRSAKYHLKKQSSIQLLDLDNSNTKHIIQLLFDELKDELKSDIHGLGHLSRWFYRCNIKCPVLAKITVSKLENLYHTIDIEELGELLPAINKIYPDTYLAFKNKHEQDLIGKFKTNTNTLSVEINNNEIFITYFAETGSDAKENLTRQSWLRLSLLKKIIIGYEKYHSKGLYIPIPINKMLKEVVDDTVKAAPKDYIDEFEVQGNQVWLNQITKHYNYDTLFDFMKFYFDLRIKGVELTKGIVFFLEQVLNKKNKKLNKEIVIFDRKKSEWSEFIEQRKGITYDDNFKEDDFKLSVKAITKWKGNLKSSLEQFFPKDDNVWRTFIYNVRALRRSVEEMQNAFDFIQMSTTKYFDTIELSKEELTIYNRLEWTVLFYSEFQKERFINVRNEISNWWNIKEIIRLNQLKQLLNQVTEKTGIETIYPKFTIEDGSFRRATIGFKIPYKEFLDCIEPIFKILLPLTKLDIDSYNIVFVQNNVTQNNILFSVNKELFIQLEKSIKEKKAYNSKYNNPYPGTVTEEIIAALEGIELDNIPKDESKNLVLEIITDLWKFYEIKNRVTGNNNFEKRWYKDLKREYSQRIMKTVKNLMIEDYNLGKRYENCALLVLDNELSFSEDDFNAKFIIDIVGIENYLSSL